jgi:hypothetical protein
MTLRASRRRAMQAALATAAAVTLPRSRAAAQQATPTPSAEGEITASQVQSAVDRLDDLIEDGMTRTGATGGAVTISRNTDLVLWCPHNEHANSRELAAIVVPSATLGRRQQHASWRHQAVWQVR